MSSLPRPDLMTGEGPVLARIIPDSVESAASRTSCKIINRCPIAMLYNA